MGLFSNDMRSQSLAWLAFARQSILAGDFPLWTPYQACGYPIFSKMGFILYPVNWLIFAMDTSSAIIAIPFAHIIIGMTGMLLYLRYLKLAPAAIGLGTFFFGYAALLQVFLGVGSTYIWMPLILLFTHRLIDRPSFPSCLALTAFLTVSFLGGFLQHFCYMSIALFLYTICFIFSRDSKRGLAYISIRIGLMGLAVVLTIFLVAVKLLPVFELSWFSVRSFAEAAKSGETPTTLQAGIYSLEVILFGTQFKLLVYYFGSILFLIPFGFFSSKNRAVVFSLAIALGYLILFTVSKYVPALSILGKVPFTDSFRLHNVRMPPFFQFFAIVMGSIGLSSLWEMGGTELLNKVRMKWHYSLFFLAIYMIGVMLSPFLFSDNPYQHSIRHALTMLAFLMATVFILLYVSRFSVSASNAGMWLVAFLVLLDVATHSYFPPSSAHTDSSTFVESDDPFIEQVIRFTEEYAENDRVLLCWPKFYPNSGTRFGFQNINSYYSLTLARWRNYVRTAVGPKWFDRHHRRWLFYGILTDIYHNRIQTQFLKQPKMAGLASLRYLIAFDCRRMDATTVDENSSWNLCHVSNTLPRLYVYENKFALPRAYLVNCYIISHSESESLEAIKNRISDLSNSVVLENGIPTFSSSSAPRNPGRVRIRRYKINEVVLDVESEESAILVLTDIYYPGWNAYINGERRPIWRANSLFRAVQISPGRHSIIFKYQPESLRWGIRISAITLLLIFVALIIERNYVRKRLTTNTESCSIGKDTPV